MQIESIGGGVENTDMADQQTIEGTVEPKADLDVLDKQVMDAAAAAQRSADACQGFVIIAFTHLADDGEIVNVDRLRGMRRIASIQANPVALQDGIPRTGAGNFDAIHFEMAIEAKMSRWNPKRSFRRGTRGDGLGKSFPRVR